MTDPQGSEPSRAELHRRCRSFAGTLLAHLTALFCSSDQVPSSVLFSH
jgi:hypothetical protein